MAAVHALWPRGGIGNLLPKVFPYHFSSALEKRTDETGRRKICSWIAYPASAHRHVKLRNILDRAVRMAKETDESEGVVRLCNWTATGRFVLLERLFQDANVPFDCGWELDYSAWSGWWRPGNRRLVVYEVSCNGEQVVDLQTLRDFCERCSSEPVTFRLVESFIKEIDRSPPVPLASWLAADPHCCQAEAGGEIKGQRVE